MANFEQAFTVVMQHEDDPKIKGKITRNTDGRYAAKLSDVPAQFQSTAVQLPDSRWYYAFTRTRYGVDERAHPELRNGGFYSTMGTDAAFVVAQTVFRQYWKFDGINDQIVATKILDACINAGPGNALKVVQRALGNSSQPIFTWHWGPAMLGAINTATPADLIASLTKCMTDYYNDDAKKQKLSATPHGWLVRAAWVGPVPTEGESVG